MRRLVLPRITALALVAVALAACGGGRQLVPAHQIGRLSSGAVVAGDAGVRVVVRTDDWPGPSLELLTLIAVEMRYANGSAQPLRIRYQDVALVTPSGQRITPTPPEDVAGAGQTGDALRGPALTEGVLAPQQQVSGFLYFAQPPAGDLTLQVDLVGPSGGEPFGAIAIPFTFD